MNHFVHNLSFWVLNVGFVKHNKDWNWKNIRSPFARLYLVTAGSARVVLENGTFDLTPGHLYLIPAFTLHSDVCDGVFEHYYLHIYEDGDSNTHIFDDYDFPLEIDAEEIDSKLFKRLCDINPSMKLPQSNPVSYDNDESLYQNIMRMRLCENYRQIESEGIVLQLFSRFLKNAKPKEIASDDRIKKVLSYIRDNINKKIEIDDLAKISCLSKDHLIRVFKAEVGQTPLNYITQRKLDLAQLLLTTTETPIKQIGQEIGYDDNSYFNRIFKNKLGVTPQNYRESKKK